MTTENDILRQLANQIAPGSSVRDPQLFSNFLRNKEAEFRNFQISNEVTEIENLIRGFGQEPVPLPPGSTPDDVLFERNRQLQEADPEIRAQSAQQFRQVAFGLNPLAASVGQALSGLAPGGASPGQSFDPSVSPTILGENPNSFEQALIQSTAPADVLITLATAGLGPAAAGALRGAGRAGRAAATVLDPVVRGNLPARIAAESAVGGAAIAGSIEAGNRLPENTPAPVRVAAQLGAGVVAGGGAAGGIGAGRAIRNAGLDAIPVGRVSALDEGSRETLRARIVEDMAAGRVSDEFSFHISDNIEGVIQQGLRQGGVAGSPLQEQGFGRIVHVFRNSDLPPNREALGADISFGRGFDPQNPPKPIASFTFDELGVDVNELRLGARAQELGFEGEPPLERLASPEQIAATRAREAQEAQRLRQRITNAESSTAPVGRASALDEGTDLPGISPQSDITAEQLRNQNRALFNSVDQSLGRKVSAADVDVPESRATELLDLETEKIANRTLEVDRITTQIAEDLRIANPLSRAAREAQISQGRSAAVGRGAPVLEAGEGRAGFNQAQAQLRGQITPEFEAPIVGGADVNILMNHIRDLPDTRFLTKINTRQALEKLLEGTSPANNELILLERAFGREMVEAFLDRPRAGADEAGTLIRDVFGVPKTIRSAFDLSAPLRQGLLLGPRNPREFSRAFRSMFRSINAESAFRMNDEILRDPEIEFLLERGLFMQAVEGAGPAALTRRDEAFISSLASKIPGVGISERTFGTFLNKLKHDVAKKALNNWRQQGLLPQGPISRADLSPEQLQRLDSLARFLNVFTGRGTIPERFQGFADIANVAFWSPRLTISRFEAPTLLADPNIRRLAAENMVATFALGATILALAEAMIPGVAVEKDPRSSDFGKMRFGNTRLDFWGGFQSTARYLAQVVTNETKSAGQEETGFNEGVIGTPRNVSRGGRILRFARSKVSPGLASVLANELSGGTFLDSPLEAPPDRGRPPEDVGAFLRGDAPTLPVVGEQNPLDRVTSGGLESAREQDAILQLTPLFGIELIDAMENYGLIRGTALSLPTLFGVGTTTFNEDLTEREIRERSAS